MPNPNLQWERTKQFDIGFETRLFNHRLGLEFDYYYKLTTDLLLDRPIPHSTGFASVMDNIGSVSNRGIETMITTTNIDNGDFNWSSTLNFNYNKNRIEKLGENDEDIEPGPWWVSGSQTILRVGEQLRLELCQGKQNGQQKNQYLARAFLTGRAVLSTTSGTRTST
jgi:outer membrane receptor protein involved in Fe transport